MRMHQLLATLLIFSGLVLTACMPISVNDIAADNIVTDDTVAGDTVVSDDNATTTANADSDIPAVAIPSETLIQLIDPLDEPEYYCIDVPGFRQSLRLDGALTAHTCKPNADDEMFTINQPAEGQLYMPVYQRCVEASAAEANAQLFLTECSESPLQQFAHNEDFLQLQSDSAEAFCIAVADKAGEPTGGPSHVVRDLMLQPCATVSASLAQWTFPGPTVQ